MRDLQGALDAAATDRTRLGAAIKPPRAKPLPPRRPRRNSVGELALIAVCLLAAAYGLQSAVRRAVAEALIGRGSPDEVELAVRLTPDNPVAWMRLALTQDDGVEALRRAAALQPGDGAGWIRLALELEAQGDIAGAEEAALRAAEADRGFEPLWTLAGFYLRQGRDEEFWRYIRAAVAARPERTPAAAALWWRLLDDPAEIWAKAAPEEPAALRHYLAYLVGRGRYEALPAVWDRVGPGAAPSDAAMAAELLESLLAAGEVDLALKVWNSLTARRLIELERLSPAEDRFLTNGSFAARISGIGFDWRLDPAPGVFRLQPLLQGSEPSLEIRLSGGQEERTLLLSQVAPLLEGERFVFHCRYVTQQLPPRTGLRWAARDHRTGRILAESEPIEAAEEFWGGSVFAFATPPGVRLVRIELSYQREPETELFQGRFVMRSAELVRAAAYDGGRP